MAKVSTAPAPVSILVLFAQVFWYRPNNFRSDYGSTNDIRNSLAERGWVQNYSVSVCPIQTDADLTDSQRERGVKSEFAICMEEREKQWKELREATTPDAAIQRSAFEKLYCKDGKLIAPKYSGNAGFRRASVYLDAMVQRMKDTSVPDGEKILDQIPVTVKSYADEAEKLVDQQLENELQGVGTVKMPEHDKLRVAMKLFRLGKREIYLRKLYSSTTGQKLFNICLADANWPALRIFQRIVDVPASDSSNIPLSKLRHDALIKLNNRFEADQKRKAGKPLSDKEKAFEPITQEDVANYLNDLRSGEGNAPKMMSKKDVEAIGKQSAIDLFKLVANAVAENKTGELATYVDHADGLNLHKRLIDAGKGDMATTALLLAEQNPAVLLSVRDALQLLSADAVVTAVKSAVTAQTAKKPVATVAAAS